MLAAGSFIVVSILIVAGIAYFKKKRRMLEEDNSDNDLVQVNTADVLTAKNKK